LYSRVLAGRYDGIPGHRGGASSLEGNLVADADLGSGQLRVMARHVFPTALYALVVVGTLFIATAIRTEASLSFLGLGIPPPPPSGGNILSEGRQYIKC